MKGGGRKGHKSNHRPHSARKCKPGPADKEEVEPYKAEDDPTETEEKFVAWLLKNGASFPKLKWPVFSWPGQVHDGERGVQVIENLDPGEEMFRIPGAILFNRDKCLKSNIGGIFRQYQEQLFSDRDELALAFLLLYEKLELGRKSFWWPMIAALPKDPGLCSLPAIHIHLTSTRPPAGAGVGWGG